MDPLIDRMTLNLQYVAPECRPTLLFGSTVNRNMHEFREGVIPLINAERKANGSSRLFVVLAFWAFVGHPKRCRAVCSSEQELQWMNEYLGSVVVDE